MISAQYITAIKAKFLSSLAVSYVAIVKERSLLESGYFRARLTLKNGDFLEVVEFFTVFDNRCITESYRYQWMDETQQTLRKRWDNVEHFPNLPNFPHHVHIGEESNVEPSSSMNILELIDLIEKHLP
ncbi:MAG: DUF6516 family protein [Tychonema bourrellyi B0820]|uniref:Uncharacterized protein n=1 Tax=Tychonema bourrellyi FEM_GT703 TaxID=2040638 RepID=A0A2G4F2G9_9CYAN|nr:DUF6516 family protein [Tychonema bourrellyi]MDQ2097293.1 DUF6516 family protein [Tychonema bourrellyi B0820]PHX55973.1 hypothetical protein CP500_007975 [Tychonema bourrellyi FEM_GT703]